MSSSTEMAELLNMPAAQPPPGVIPNFTNPYSDASTFIVVSAILVTFTIAFVAVRIYTKVRIVCKFSPDDYTCIIGTVGIIIMFVLSNIYVPLGHIGTHMWDLTIDDLGNTVGFYCLFFIDFISCIILLLVKLGFFLMYLQIFYPLKWLRYGSYVGATVDVLFYTAIVVATLAYSIPTPGQTLAEAMQGQRYRSLINLSLPAASMSLILDVYILVLPIAGLAKLQLPPKRKALVMLVFLMGFIACIASSMSIYYKWLLQNDESDVTYVYMPTLLLGLAELCTGAIASCMPSMTAFLRHLPNWFTLYTRFLSTSNKSSQKSRSTDVQDRSFNSSSGGGGGAGRVKGSMSFKEPRNNYKNLENGTMRTIGGSEFEMGEKNMNMMMSVPANARTVRTYVHAGGRDLVGQQGGDGNDDDEEEEGIRLQYDIDRKVSDDVAV